MEAGVTQAADPAPVIAALVRDGHLQAADEERFRRLHAFSRAINNDDTHLGNYGLLIDDAGRATLAPAYDVLPMALAPRHDELPDRFLKRVAPADAGTAALVRRLIEVVERDASMGNEFVAAWSKSVA